MSHLRATRRASSAALWLAALATSFALHACSDVGDSSAISAGETGEDAGPGPTEDAAEGLGEASPENDGGASADLDAGGGDANARPTGDAGTVTGNDDAGNIEDSSSEDVIVVVVDAGADATIVDSGLPDTGSTVDAGVDAGFDSSVGVDAGQKVDAGVDAGHGQNALAPCTTAGQANCVQCQYNNGAEGTAPNASQLCTPTEAALVQHDITTGQATAAGPDPDSSCYACAALSGCLDDSEFNDQGHECEDLAGASKASECEATLACVLSTGCGVATISTCYCGTAPVSGTCAAAGASNAANGQCKAAEATGLGFASNDGLDILKNFTSTTLPSGVANNILQCAASNNCTTCLH